MKRLMFALAACAAAVSVAPAANATIILSSSTGVAPTAGVPLGQGTLLASQTFTGSALTFSATFNQAVYRNTAGTLDFYYQVLRTGAGTDANEEIRSFTVSNFGGYVIDGYAAGTDPDGAGFFVAANNPTLANGTPSGSTTTFGRSPNGGVLTTEFGANGLTGTENSATYIFRTNAVDYNSLGFFGIIDGSTLNGRTFMPIGPGVPEPATWAMMMLGFGAMGAMIRRRKTTTSARIRFA